MSYSIICFSLFPKRKNAKVLIKTKTLSNFFSFRPRNSYNSFRNMFFFPEHFTLFYVVKTFFVYLIILPFRLNLETDLLQVQPT